MEEYFQIIDNYLMIKMPEEIDHHSAARISKGADDFLVHKRINNVVFDFESTRFMDSSGIGIIIGRYKKVSVFGGRVYIVNPDRRIRRVLAMSGLNNIAEIME